MRLRAYRGVGKTPLNALVICVSAMLPLHHPSLASTLPFSRIPLTAPAHFISACSALISAQTHQSDQLVKKNLQIVSDLSVNNQKAC